jgi:putrescine aminotransferase
LSRRRRASGSSKNRQYNFAEHFNRGWLEYRKSVTEAGQWAATEWNGKGSIFEDVLGRQYIDFLGGFGMMDLAGRIPKLWRL